MKKIMKTLMPLLILTLLLCGCGAKSDYTSLTLSKSGSLKQVIVEEWDQEKYDKKELKEQIETDIAAYDSRISLKSIKTQKDKVVIQMNYKDVEAYADYNGVVLFAGTIAQCQAAGYLLEGEFKDTSGEDVARTDVLLNQDKYNVLVFQEPMQVTVPKKIICCSSSLEVIGKKKVKASMPEGDTGSILSNLVYVVYK